MGYTFSAPLPATNDWEVMLVLDDIPFTVSEYCVTPCESCGSNVIFTDDTYTQVPIEQTHASCFITNILSEPDATRCIYPL